MKNRDIISTILFLTLYSNANSLKKDLVETSGELRVGAIHIENNTIDKTDTLSLGGKLNIRSKPIYGLSAGITFYTTNALFGLDSEAMFLSSTTDSYSIIGEAYIQANFDKTEIKAGRQLFESPFINSDDIGMIPDIVEGYSLIDKSINSTSLILGLMNSWSGIDSDKPELFTKMQNSGDDIIIAGLIYEGINNTTFQAWKYKLEDEDWNYFEASYENDICSIAGQYSTQGSKNSVYGLDGVMNIKKLSLHLAYNKVSGIVSNGFGGGPFFTSSEDHTIHETLNHEAKLMGMEYNINKLTLSLTHVDFNRGEDETDYLASYKFSDDLAVDLIYSDMNHDGDMSRFFLNYSF